MPGHYFRSWVDCVGSNMGKSLSTLEHDVTVPGELAERVRKQEKELERLREQLRLWEEEFGTNPAREALFSTS